MPLEFINESLQFFISFFSEGHARIFPMLHWFLGKLLAIDILLFGAFVAFGHVQALGRVFPKVLYIGFLIHLLTFWPELVRLFALGMIQLGLIAGGSVLTEGAFLNPGTLVAEGFRIATPLITSVASFSLFRSPVSTLINMILGFSLFAAVIIMAVRLYIAIVELYVGMVMSSILLPFAMLPATAPFAQIGIGYAVASSFRLGILAFVMSAVTAILAQIALPEDPAWSAALIALTILLILAVLVVKAPQIAGGILTGGPVLTAGSLVSTAAVVGGTVAGVAGGAATAATRAAGAAVTTTSAAKAAYAGGGATGIARLPASFAASSSLAHAGRASLASWSSRGQAIGAHAAHPEQPVAPPPSGSSGSSPAWVSQWSQSFRSSSGPASRMQPDL